MTPTKYPTSIAIGFVPKRRRTREECALDKQEEAARAISADRDEYTMSVSAGQLSANQARFRAEKRIEATIGDLPKSDTFPPDVVRAQCLLLAKHRAKQRTTDNIGRAVG